MAENLNLDLTVILGFFFIMPQHCVSVTSLFVVQEESLLT